MYCVFIDAYSELAGSWVAGVVDTNQWLQVDMGTPYRFTRVYIQGRPEADEWVTSFKILYYNDDTASWDEYTDSGGLNVS